MKRDFKILIQWPFLLALGILLVNDHYLKAAYPGWLTGKLSDFAGLFVLAVFIYAVAGRYLQSVGARGRTSTTKTTRSLITLHLAIAVSFVVWKIAPVELIFTTINKLVDIPLPGRVKDPTDLIALAILPLSYLYIKYVNRTTCSLLAHMGVRSQSHFDQSQNKVLAKPAMKRLASVCVLMIACFSMIATPSGRRYDIKPNIEQETSRDWVSLRTMFEQVLSDNQIEIKDSHSLDDSTYMYKIFFKDKQVGKYKDGKPKYREFTSFIKLQYSPSGKTIGFNSIYGWVVNDMPNDKTVDKAYMQKIIEPFVGKLKE